MFLFSGIALRSLITVHYLLVNTIQEIYDEIQLGY